MAELCMQWLPSIVRAPIVSSCWLGIAGSWFTNVSHLSWWQTILTRLSVTLCYPRAQWKIPDVLWFSQQRIHLYNIRHLKRLIKLGESLKKGNLNFDKTISDFMFPWSSMENSWCFMFHCYSIIVLHIWLTGPKQSNSIWFLFPSSVVQSSNSW